MAIELTRIPDALDASSLLLRITGANLQQGMDKIIAGELADAIERFVKGDEQLRAQIQQKIDEAFSGVNIAAIVTAVVTEIAVSAAKYAMEKTAKDLSNPEPGMVNRGQTLEKARPSMAAQTSAAK